MPYTPSPVPKRMLSWRDDERVYDLAVDIAKETGESKQSVFGRLFRTGIAMHDAMDAVRLYLVAQRAEQIDALSERPDDYIRKDAETQQVLHELYQPTDLEVIQWIQQAVSERIEGQGVRELYYRRAKEEAQRPAAASVPRARKVVDDPLWPDGTKAYPCAAPVDALTLVVTLNEPIYQYIVAARYGEYSVQIADSGSSWWEDRANKHVQNAMKDGVCGVEISDDARIRIQVDGDDLFLITSLLNVSSGEYESGDIETYKVDAPPTSVVLRWPGHEVRIAADGVKYYVPDGDQMGGAPGLATISYAGWSARLPMGETRAIVSQSGLIG